MPDLKQLIGRISVMGSHQTLMRAMRKFTLQTASLARGSPEKIRSTIEGIAEIEAFVTSEAGSWLEPEDIAEGLSGPFDGCDLRVWLLLAEKAGVAAIPARTILTLTEDELSSVCEQLPVPEHMRKTIARGIGRAFPDLEQLQNPGPDPDPQIVWDRLHTAMDDVPLDWMVRSNIAGSSMLKALAGTGVIGDGREGSKLSDAVEVGAGWVQVGNRRRIDATDSRFVDTFVTGHKSTIHYLARPWATPSRRLVGEDPHRHGSQFAGKGSWPAEWRVFVTAGKVTGVSSYYGWAGEAKPEDAHNALEAAGLAQRIVDAAMRMNLSPRLMDIELLRSGPMGKVRQQPEVHALLATHPADGVSCTLDFMETDQGMMLIEGGPGHSLVGGAFPCNFAGNGIRKETGLYCQCEGFALKLIDGVNLAEPSTWKDKDPGDSILSWDQTRALAAEFRTPDNPEDPSP